MARYAISAEGAASMRALAKQLYTNANSILEASSVLETKVSAVGERLGIYENEILTIVQRNRNTLSANREEIISLSQQILKKADDIDALALLTATTSAPCSNVVGTRDSKAKAIKSQYQDINDIPQKEFECIAKYNSDSASFNTPIRNHVTTKDTKLLSQMISERELSESKTLYRRATLEDLNGLDVSQIDTLVGQSFSFSGFMSATPDAKLPNYVSHGNVFFEYSVPAGTNALDLTSLMYNEVVFDSPRCQIDRVEKLSDGNIKIIASII